MSRIAIIIDQDFEDSEYQKPADALKEAGHEIVHVGIKANAQVRGKKQGTNVHVEKAAKDVKVEDFDALLIPGGYSPDHLRIDEGPVQFVRNFVNSGKPVFSICHAPQIMVTADVLRGRKIAGWKSIAQDIKNAGAEFVDEEVVEDSNIISSRSPQDIPAFNNRILERLENRKQVKPDETPTWDQPESATRR